MNSDRDIAIFANGPIQADFAVFASKLFGMCRSGLITKVVRQALAKIDEGIFESAGRQGILELYTDEDFTAELRLETKSVADAATSVSTLPFQTCMISLAGELSFEEYTLDSTNTSLTRRRLLQPHDVYLFCKTSESAHLYRVILGSDTALVVVATSQRDHDDIYLTYNLVSQEREAIISSDLQESRMEFWIEFLRETGGVERALLEELLRAAKSRKFRGYLEGQLVLGNT